VDSDTLFLVMPAYNEQANIIETLRSWYPIVEKIGPDSRLVIMDDGSKDNTFECMEHFAQSHPQFVALTHENAGHGATVLELYRYALTQGADYVFQTDSDGQTDPKQFWGFWEDRAQFDMIIGWRKGREDGFSRILVTKTLKFVIKHIFSVSVTDANTPFRLMSAESLRQNIGYIPDGYNLSNVILSVIYEKRHQKTDYRVIAFRPRQGGVNSINIPRIFGIGRQALSDFKAINRSLSSSLK
jgi:glycosyltransferase involved in cell wall biosynthesis